MNKNGQVGIGIGGIVIIFIGIVFSLALFSPIADTVGLMSNKQVVTNQSISVVDAYLTNETVNESIEFTIYSQSDWKAIDCALTSVAIRNGAGTALVADTDYILDASAGTFTLNTTAKTYPATSLNLSYADYSYCADGYNKDSGSRTILNLILIFSVLIILAFVLEKSGVIDMGLGK